MWPVSLGGGFEGNDPAIDSGIRAGWLRTLAPCPPRGVWESERWQLERNGNLDNCGSTAVGTVCLCVRVSTTRWGKSKSRACETLSSRAGLHPTRANEELGCRVGAQVQVSVEPNPLSGV